MKNFIDKYLNKKFGLVYFIITAILLIGLVPLVLTGWLLSGRSGEELRGLEGRYQTQLVQDKARQIEMLGQRYIDLTVSFARAFEFSQDFSLLSSSSAHLKLGQSLKENPSLLGLYVKPVTGDPLSVYKSEVLNEGDLASLSSSILKNLTGKNLIINGPIKNSKTVYPIITLAVPVLNNKQEVMAAVVAVVELDEISRIMSDVPSSPDKQLWEQGLPIIFVIDEKGNPVFYPDRQAVIENRSMEDLKIVQEWRQSSGEIQSALVPFTATREEKDYRMIGAYSNASFSNILNFGVISMQDEAKALASVKDMRNQTWLISMGFAVFALIIGVLLARQLTIPMMELVSAAENIAGGDLSRRISPKNIKELEVLRTSFNFMSDSVSDHIAKLAKAAQENRELFIGTVKALSAAIDGKDRYTRGHSERVARISLAIGTKLNLPSEELETLRISALLHDVGKIAIDDAILKKPSALTDAEFEIMKTHPEKGYKIMSQIPAMKDFLPGMYSHHEMVDGNGYPQGLSGADIPLQAKIVSVADTFDAMTTDRPYQKGMKMDEALNRIKSFVGSRYDGKVVEALVVACREGQVREVGVHPNAQNSVSN